MADEDSNDQYREFAPGLQTAPARSAPDLYEAMGGRLNSLNDQLSGFQNELAGMTVPAPNIVPPDVTSPLGQLGSVLADSASAWAGIRNPVTEKQEAYRAQTMEGLKEKRSILQQRFGIAKEQVDLIKANLEIEHQRTAQEDAVLKFIPTLLAENSPPEAKLMGKQILQTALGKRGFTGDLGDFTGKPFNKDDVNDILVSKERGLPEVVVRGAHPKMPDGMFRLLWDQPKLSDEMLPGLIPGYKTKDERLRAAEDHTEKMRKAVQEARKADALASMPGGGLTTDNDLVVMDAEHIRRNGDKHYWEGTDASKKLALADWNAWKTASQDPMAKVGLAGLLQQNRQDNNRHTVDQGRGKWYNAKTDMYRTDINGIERASGDWKAIGKDGVQMLEFADRAMNLSDKLRNLLPKVLSDTPGDVMRLLSNKANRYTGADPNMVEFDRLVALIPVEEARILGSSSNVRQRLYDVLQKHASVKPYDTQRSAKQAVDSLKVDLYNFQAVTHGMPQLLPGQRIGPGKFLFFPMDPVTKSPIFKDPVTGQSLGQISKPLAPGQVSPADVYIMETVE